MTDKAKRKLIMTEIVAKLELFYPLKPVQATTPGGGVSKAYQTVINEIVEALEGFSDDAISGGWRLIRERHTKRTWPIIGEIISAVGQAEQDIKDDVALAAQKARGGGRRVEPPERKPMRDPAEIKHFENKCRRARQALDFTIDPPLNDEEFARWYYKGEMVPRLAAYLGADPTESEPTPPADPAIAAREIVETVDRKSIGAHWRACKSGILKRELTGDRYRLIENLWAEYDDGEVMLISTESRAQHQLIAEFTMVLSELCDRRVLIASQLRGRGYTKQHRIDHYEAEVEKQRRGSGDA